MKDIGIGFLLIFSIYSSVRIFNDYHNYKNTVYPEIFSGFFEFEIRKGSNKGLKKSYWLNEQFGENRIVYFDKINKVQITYMLVIISSGLYLFNVKNFEGKLTKNKKGSYKYKTSFINKKNGNISYESVDVSNPIYELNNFRLNEEIRKKYVVVLDKCTLNNIDTSTFIYASNIVKTIKEDYEISKDSFSCEEIKEIYNNIIKEGVKIDNCRTLVG